MWVENNADIIIDTVPYGTALFGYVHHFLPTFCSYRNIVYDSGVLL
jgi:hypothetical protein